MADTKTPDKVTKSEGEWRKELTPMQYAVLREKATERPFSGEYEYETKPGTYVCAGCPSFPAPAGDSHVDEERDTTHGMIRTEVLCSKCSGHLGHVFPDGPGPTGLRYCINSGALKLKQKEKGKSGRTRSEPRATKVDAGFVLGCAQTQGNHWIMHVSKRLL